MTHANTSTPPATDPTTDYRPLTSDLPYEVVHFLDVVASALVRVIQDEYRNDEANNGDRSL